MGSVSYHISFRGRAQGPISSGAIFKHVRDYQADVAEELGEDAENQWLYRLNNSLRHQRPYYTTRIETKRLAFNRYLIHDNGVVYGHWLEGTGSRNSPVTRFPGYWSMRETKMVMKGYRRKVVAEEILEQHQARGRLI